MSKNICGKTKHLSKKQTPFIKSAFIMLMIATSNLNAQPAGQTATPKQLVQALHTAFGEHHARAVHAKGIILEGEFTPAPEAAILTKAFHLQNKNSRVIVRFSDFTGIPTIPDNIGLANPRGMSIKFVMPDGKTTDIIAHSFNGFPTPNSDQFRELLLAIGASGADAAKPTALDKFLGSHPIAKTFLSTQKNPASFASISYFGVNSFKFTNKNGQSHYVRYQFIPVSGEKLLSADEMAKLDSNYLFADIKKQISEHPIQFQVFAQIAESSDKIKDPSIAWPDSRKKVLLGTIKIKQLAPNTEKEDKALFFIPNNIPSGIQTADPMLDFRSNAYPISVIERQ
jgi:catalase